jgi:hypothetical protein
MAAVEKVAAQALHPPMELQTLAVAVAELEAVRANLAVQASSSSKCQTQHTQNSQAV